MVAHLADIHLGRRLYGLPWTGEEIIEHFREAVDKALKDHVDAILISGDMFDLQYLSRRKIAVLKQAMDILRKPYEKGVKIYGILGEHDIPKTNDLPLQAVIPYMKLLGTKTTPLIDCFEKEGVRYCIAGVSHYDVKVSTKLRDKLLKKIKEAMNLADGKTILMLHQNIENFFRMEPGLSLDELPEKPVYIAMGHLHWRIKHWRNNQLIAYPGSLDIVKIDEYKYLRQYGKGFYYIDLSGDQPVIEDVDTDTIPVSLVETNLEKLVGELDKAINTLPLNRKSILYIKVKLESNKKNLLDRIIQEYEKRYKGRIYLRIEREYKDLETSVGEEEAAKNIDELAVKTIAEILGDKQNTKLAEKILMLRDALLEEDQETLRRLIDEIASEAIWDRLVARKYIKLSRRKQETQQPTRDKTISPITTRRGRIDLFSYVGKE